MELTAELVALVIAVGVVAGPRCEDARRLAAAPPLNGDPREERSWR